MIIEKILNNNVVMTTNPAGEEVVCMGRGLAFQKKIGEEINPAFIQKEFILKDSSFSSQFQELFSDLPPEEVELVKKIVDLAEEKLETELSTNIYLTLTDHIHHAILRAKEGIELTNPLKYETRKFYPKEYEVALQGIALLNESFEIQLTDNEAGFIAFHIVNATQANGSMDVTMNATEMVGDILTIISRYFGIVFDENSLAYQRMVTHIQFFAQRYLKDEVYNEKDEFLYELIPGKYPKAFQAVQRINQFLLGKYDKSIDEAEQTYLTIHIQRIIAKDEQ
ncbi:beta-glucoside operon transcriptional antiterminator [Enterococcus sp. PF1-24]|uniref:BglG family transcription antiterminator LicT n=1 Tax=unclassified Enterococcus TaxID=2608891 RepID=UPI0024763F37|nr:MULTISPECIES: PRD domain-containing protein [unclassified Enterococcus]MDH6364994.1 beta-glucoside operon transcriptional antiterminator [Enterococcus sp. PFB1-1]MDH6402095.1 beta-glucoside operon transcriptional antiterminator [Enterococcus sp. PF1-24]